MDFQYSAAGFHGTPSLHLPMSHSFATLGDGNTGLPRRPSGMDAGRPPHAPHHQPHGEPVHPFAFQEHLEQHATEHLSKEWDSLFLGDDGANDVLTTSDVYRHVRRDFRTMACALKQSFAIMVDGGHLGVHSPQMGAAQQLQPLINELRTVSKVGRLGH